MGWPLLLSLASSCLALFVVNVGFGVLHHVVITTESLVACWLSTLEWLLNDSLPLTTWYSSSFCLLLQCVSFHAVSSAPHDRIAWCNWDNYMQTFLHE
jgi:hypothetical protein